MLVSTEHPWTKEILDQNQNVGELCFNSSVFIGLHKSFRFKVCGNKPVWLS